MSGAAMTATPAEVSRAYRLRQKLERGLPIPDAARAWLERYELDHPTPFRTGALAPVNDNNTPPASGGATSAAGVPGAELGSPTSAPAWPAGGVLPSSPDVPPPIVVAATATPPSSAELEQLERRKLEIRKHAESLAGVYAEWLKAANAEIAQLGGLPIPAELIDGLIKPQAAQLIERTMPQEMLSERAQGVLVLGAGGVSVVQRHFLRRRAGVAPASSPRVEGAATATAPTALEPEAAPSSWHAPLVR